MNELDTQLLVKLIFLDDNSKTELLDILKDCPCKRIYPLYNDEKLRQLGFIKCIKTNPKKSTVIHKHLNSQGCFEESTEEQTTYTYIYILTATGNYLKDILYPGEKNGI